MITVELDEELAPNEEFVGVISWKSGDQITIVAEIKVTRNDYVNYRYGNLKVVNNKED